MGPLHCRKSPPRNFVPAKIGGTALNRSSRTTEERSSVDGENSELLFPACKIMQENSTAEVPSCSPSILVSSQIVTENHHRKIIGGEILGDKPQGAVSPLVEESATNASDSNNEEKVAPMTEENKNLTENFNCSTSGGEQSCLSLSSDGENGASVPENQPVSSSGYGSENLPSQQDKQQKKKRLQQCLKELKQLITKQTTPSPDVAQKLGTIEALTQALEILKRKPCQNQSPGSPMELKNPESVSKSVNRSDSSDFDLSLLPAEAAIFTGDSTESSASACSATVKLPDGMIVDVSDNFLVFTGLSRDEIVEHKRFTDLVEPEDRPLLVLTSLRACSFRPTQMSLFARLRQGPLSNVMPCHLHCVLSQSQDGSHLTKISISSLISAYSEAAKETLSNIRFCIRHSVSCKLTFVDASSVPFLGWLPQDLLGQSLLKYIHKDDIPLLFEAYEAMVKNHGKPVRSKPYRVRLYNGDFAGLETEWTIFQNPWTKKVDFVVGNSRVVEDPANNKDVFAVSSTETGAGESRITTRLVGDELIMMEQKFANLLSQPIQAPLKHKKKHSNSQSSSAQPKESPTQINKSVKIVTSPPEAHRGLTRTQNPQIHDSNFLPSQSSQSAPKKRKEVSALAYMDSLVENIVISGINPREPQQNLPHPHVSPNAGFGGHLEGSPEGNSGEEMSGSPPESSGSGPFSYSQINCMENVQRLLQSQPRTHSSNESGVNQAGEKSSGENSKSNSASPPHGDPDCVALRAVNLPHPAMSLPHSAMTLPPPAMNLHYSPLNLPHPAMNLSQHPAAAHLMHRSQSAMQLEDHPPMPLTRELLKQHTKKWEKEYKESWKRRFSEEMSIEEATANNPHTSSAPVNHMSPLKRALETSALINPDTTGICPEKIFRSDRPASMPVLPRPGNNEIFATEWNQFLNSKAAEEYYRSLGPNPPPPPGRNVHISSAPLPPAPLPLNLETSQADAKKSAFAPLLAKKQSEISSWDYNNPPNQPLNFSMHRENNRNGNSYGPNSGNPGPGPGQKSVIQASPFFHNQSMVVGPGSGNSSRSSNWFGTGSSTSLHKSEFADLQLARAKEASWLAGVPLTEDLVLRYRHPPPMDAAEVLARDHQRLLQMTQPKMVNEQLEKVYSEMESAQISQPKQDSGAGSAVKEATDALILLQEG